jgi:hypothetical protein
MHKAFSIWDTLDKKFMVNIMGKASNLKPRMAYAIDNENKDYLEQWADEEGRSVANLVERLLLDAIAKKKEVSTEQVERRGKSGSNRKK